MIEAIKNSFLDLDAEIRKNLNIADIDPQDMYPSFVDKSGTTVVACLLTTKHIYLINCGDSRGIFVRRKSQLEIVTYDHKPSQLKEKKRIQNAGGMVVMNRVNGGLATSRGLGDYEYKSVFDLDPYLQYVSVEPDCYVIDRQHDRDHYIVLACDGIWDVKSNEEIMRMVEDELDDCHKDYEVEKITNRILDACLDAVRFCQ